MGQGTADAWEQMPRESAGAYRAFLKYRDQEPPRRLQAVADAIDRKYSTAKALSMRWKWRSRAVAWDREVQRFEDEKRLQARGDAIRKAEERDVAEGLALRQAGMLPVSAIIRRMNEDPEVVRQFLDPDTGRPAAVEKLLNLAKNSVRMVDTGSKLHRRGLGLAERVERQEQTGRDGAPIEHEVQHVKVLRFEPKRLPVGAASPAGDEDA